MFMKPKYHLLENLGVEMIAIQRSAESVEMEKEQYRLKAAMYRNFFIHNFALWEKLQEQVTENTNALIGEFDGFSYASWRANAVFRTLENMFEDGILTEKEYMSCMSI